jgi:cell division septal protein FtsQ
MALGRVKPGWYALGALGLGLVVWFGAGPLARRMSFFQVRRVEFAGLRYGSPRSTLAALRIPRSLSIFDDLKPIERRAKALPGVDRARVGRRLPATLRVELEEREPVALTPSAAAMRLIDARGRLLPFDPARSAPDLPIAETPDALVARLLSRVQEFDPELFERVASARRDQDDVVLDVGGKSLRFRPDASLEDMHLVTAVEAQLAREGKSYRELDGRFAGQVIVRGGA